MRHPDRRCELSVRHWPRSPGQFRTDRRHRPWRCLCGPELAARSDHRADQWQGLLRETSAELSWDTAWERGRLKDENLRPGRGLTITSSFIFPPPLISYYCLHHSIKQQAICGNCVASANRSRSIPISKRAFSLFQNRKQRSAIPNVHHRVEHDIGPAGCDENVSVSVTPRPACMNLSLQRLCRGTKAVLLAHSKVSRQKSRLIQ